MYGFVPPDGPDGLWVESSIDFPFEVVQSRKSESSCLVSEIWVPGDGGKDLRKGRKEWSFISL